MAKEKKPTKIWDNCKGFGEVQKSDALKLKVELVARDGVKYISIREWYLKKSTGEWKPGLKGIAVPVKLPIGGNVHNVMEELLPIIGQALGEVDEFLLADPDNEVWG